MDRSALPSAAVIVRRGAPAVRAGGGLLSMLLVFFVIGCIAIVAERLAPLRPQPLLRRGIVTDGVYTLVNILLRVLLTNALAGAFVFLGGRLLPPSATNWVHGLWLPLQIAVVVLVLDFFAYWMHRGKHRWSLWWRLHEAHHSSRELDWFSSVRFHPLEKILDRLIYLAPLVVLAPSPEALLGLAVVDAVIATASHSNCDFRIGPLIYVFVGPEMHRWHHARSEIHQQRNFGNNLSIFDWLFGTAEVPDEAPTRFGLDDDAYPDVGFFAQLVSAFRPFEAPAPASAAEPSSVARPLPVRVHSPGSAAPSASAARSAADGDDRVIPPGARAGDLSRMRTSPDRHVTS
jgi:sterol desaturase/sphingolipid hydroxylase (fatty acid hydroxylase superfamily)